MYSVLVTDDEPTAVKHIESIIEKKCPDFYEMCIRDRLKSCRIGFDDFPDKHAQIGNKMCIRDSI